MKKIKECKISLMEKDKDFSISEEGKANYIIRTSGTFLPENYLEQEPRYQSVSLDKEDYLDFVSQAAGLIAENLIEQNKNKEIHTVGIWITFTDDEKVDSSMDLSTMDLMVEHHEGLNPYFEFAKMTLQPFYESEVSE